MFRLSIHPIVIAVLLLCAGCEHSTAPTGPVVLVSADASAITVDNLSNDDIYYFMVESSIVPLIDWMPRSRPENRIATRSVASFPLTNSSYLPSRTVYVYWWRRGALQPDSVSYGAEGMRCEIVSLPPTVR